MIQFKKLPSNYFAEGLERVNNRLIQITLKKNTAWVYNMADLTVIDQFEFSGNGWGLVNVGDDLIISDGSSILRRISIKDYRSLSQHDVTVNGVKLEGINEMEYINGMIYANVWPTDCIAIIDPEKHQVAGWIDLSQLYPEEERLNPHSVLNGIAYDPLHDKMLVTGKHWPQIYHLKLKRYPGRQ